MNRINKVSRQNIKRGYQQLLAHPLTLKMHLHDEHPHPLHLVKNLATHERNFCDKFLEKFFFFGEKLGKMSPFNLNYVISA
jgi:hypothetical protein